MVQINKMRLHECICTPTRVRICMYMHTYTQTYIYTCAYIYICTHTRIHAHTYTYAYICTPIHRWKSQQRRLNVSSNIIDARTYLYTYACIYICICMYTYVHTLQRVCSQFCTLMSQKTCVTYTPAHALVPRTPVPKCTQHSLQKMHIYIYIHTYAYTYICARTHMRIHNTAQLAKALLQRLTI